MARRTILTPAQRAALLALPADRAALARHHTLSEAELAVVGRRRRARNHLGFALQLCALRYPGRLLRPGELVPTPVVTFVAEQIGVDPAALADYGFRENTRYEHSAALQDALGYRPFAGRPRREVEAWLDREAVLASSGGELAVGLRDELRRRRVIVPGVTTLERLCGAALARAEREVLHELTRDLGRERTARLEALLAPRPEGGGTTWLAWLRQPAEGASPAAFATTVERLGRLRSVGIEAARATRVPRRHLLRLAREAERLPAADLRDLAPIHRRGILVALVLELVPRLTDEALDLHGRLVGRMFRRAERRQLAALGDDRRPIGRTVRLFARVGAELLAAKAEGRDAFAAIEGSVGWERFAAAVEEAKGLAGRHGKDPVELVEASYARLRRHAPLLLETFTVRGIPAVRPLLDALELLRGLNRADRRGLPDDAPTGFVPRRWRPFVTRDGGGLDRRFWELCAMAELRNGLRGGDVWVEGSRRYRSLEDDLVPLGRALEILPESEAGDPATFLEARRRRLEEALGEVERLAATAALPDAGIRNGRLTVVPLRAGTPREAVALSDLLYEALPRVRITDLLEEVDRWTGFSDAFAHLKTGLPARERRALLTAVLADGTNMGFKRMAEACRGVSFWQLARVVDWHVREETYLRATARLVDAQRALPLAELWGGGRMASSDGQFFRAGGHGLAPSEINARYGGEPGVSFYSHLSDQFGAFYTKVIAATAHEAPHILDGLLLHGTSLRIEEHATDTGGFTEIVFGLCALLGFRFVPRIRDLPESRLYVPGEPAAWPTLEPMIGGRLRERLVIDNWPDIQRLIASIRAGVVLPSHLVGKLAARPRRSGLARALHEIGRLERTLFTLDFLRNPTLRHEIQTSLNKGEAGNNLRKAVFFHRLGQVRDRAYENQQHRARGLNLLVAAIVLWNTRYLGAAVAALRGRGHAIGDELLQHVWPLHWEHINLTGDYTWADPEAGGPGRLRELRLDPWPRPTELRQAA